MCVEDHHIGDDFGQELQHQTSAARYALSVEHNCEDKEEDTRLHRLPLQMLRVEGRILKGNVELEPDRAGRDAAKKKDGEKATYWGLIVLHPNYRWFLISYVVTHCGEWLTYVASMALLETAQSGTGHVLVSMMVVARLVSNMTFSFAGGVLADTQDRKQVMLVLDLMGAVVALGYLHARSSIAVLYLCAILQSGLSGLYEPSRAAILPLLVGPEYLEKANELTGIFWSLSAALGSSLGGFVVGHYGATACFLTDSSLYLLSAFILNVKLKGEFNVSITEDKLQREGRLIQSVGAYLKNNESALYLLIKGCGALLFGAADVLNVTFSQVEGVMDSQRLGWLFTAIGAGCLVGPLVMPEGRSYLAACIASYFVLGLGYGLIGWSNEFWLKCLWTAVKSAGSAVLWVDSSILLQTTTPSSLLGRISAIDFALATLGEAVSAIIAGVLQDQGMSADNVALVLSGMCFFLTALWAAVFFRRRRLRLNKEARAAIELKPLLLESV